MSSSSSPFQDFLDRHVKEGTAPGLQGVVFDRNGIVFTGASGVRTLASDDKPAQPMTTESIHWIASCTKYCISLAVLRLLEQAKDGPLTLDSLDDHAALIKVLPEFDHARGHNVTKLITGYKEADEKTSDGKRIPILAPSKNKVTLRQLLTHSAGLAYYWNEKQMAEWYRPSDESTPNGILAFASGRIADFDVPLVQEGGEKYTYSPATDWLGQFIIRTTGKNLRQSFIDLLLEPLGLSPSKIDMMVKHLRAAGNEDMAGFVVRGPPQSPFIQIPFGIYEPDQDDPPEGYAHFASANIHTSLPVYAQLLRAGLTHDPRLLSEETWKLAEADNTTSHGVHVPYPNMPTFLHDLSHHIDHFLDFAPDEHVQGGNKSTASGINLFQAHVALTTTRSGLSPGAYSWAGLGNTFWFVDRTKGVGACVGTQLLPFHDPKMVQLRDEWEKLVVGSVKSTTGA